MNLNFSSSAEVRCGSFRTRDRPHQGGHRPRLRGRRRRTHQVGSFSFILAQAMFLLHSQSDVVRQMAWLGFIFPTTLYRGAGIRTHISQ